MERHKNNKLNIAILSPAENAYSETFIQAHRDMLPENIFYYYGDLMPTHLDGFGPLDQEEGGNILKKLSNSFFRNKIDVILAEYGYTAAESFPAIKDSDIPLVVHFHGMDAHSKEIFQNCGDRYKEFFEYASRVIAVSRDMEKRLIEIGCSKEKIVYAPYGPNNEYFDVEPTFEKKQFIAVGRFVEKKAPRNTIQAFRGVLNDYPMAKLRMAADGPLLNPCKKLVSQLGIEKNIEFLGVLSRDAIKKEMAQSLAFVQHSITAANGDSEGTPVAILEAGAAGLPVIATRHTGIKDVVVEEETGLLVNEHDVYRMTEAMKMLLGNTNLAKQMGVKARKRIKKSFPIEKHISLIDEVLVDSAKSGAQKREKHIDRSVLLDQDNKTSIIITCHNYGKFLKQAVESSLGQSAKPKEIIVVNDASTDDTEKVARGFGDEIRYYYVDFKNAQKTRNFGLKKAKGEYAVFLDADDYFRSDFLQKTQAELGKDNDLALVYTDRINLIGKDVEDKIDLPREWKTEDFDYQRLTEGNYISLTSLIRKKDFTGFDENIKRLQDWDAWLTLLKNKKAKRIAEFLFHVRFHGKNKTIRIAVEIEKLKILIKHGLVKMSQSEIIEFCGEVIQQKEEIIHQKEAEFFQKDQAIQQKDQAIRQKEAELEQKETVIRQKNKELQQKGKTIRERDIEIQNMKASKLWKLREKYLAIKKFFS